MSKFIPSFDRDYFSFPDGEVWVVPDSPKGINYEVLPYVALRLAFELKDIDPQSENENTAVLCNWVKAVLGGRLVQKVSPSATKEDDVKNILDRLISEELEKSNVLKLRF